MSGGLAPSKSTVYVSNLPFSLTNNDLHKIFEEYGKVIKVTVMKDKETRRSRGVAFVMFMNREEACACSKAVDGKEMFGRTLKASIAKDNGRSAEFIRRKDYPDKSKCYECGDEGHLSYQCSHNVLGKREPPPKKQRIRKKAKPKEDDDEEEVDSDDVYEPDVENLSSAIALEQEKIEKEFLLARKSNNSNSEEIVKKQKQDPIKRKSYFSDEEDSD